MYLGILEVLENKLRVEGLLSNKVEDSILELDSVEQDRIEQYVKENLKRLEAEDAKVDASIQKLREI